MGKYFPVGLSLDQETLEGLDLLARHQDRNRSQVLRVLVKKAVEELRKELEVGQCTRSK
jgi:metal-responsive CopG/Arc/MetJ family transcriptional regulator